MAEQSSVARYTYRLRLSSSARRMLLTEWDRCRWVWNQCVARSRETHAYNRENPGYPRTCGPAQLDKLLTGWRAEHEWLRAGSSVAQQQVVRDFGGSRAKALKDVRERVPQWQRAGMPHFKKRSLAEPTLNYTQRGFRLRDGVLRLAGGIAVRPLWSRELPAAPSSVRVHHDNLGHWYCSFVVRTHVQALPLTGRVIGIDWGVKELATTTSDAYDLPHPQHGKKAAKGMARYQRMMARRRPAKGRPGSKGYHAAKRQAAKIQKMVARRRQDTGRKWAKQVVRDHDALAVENFRPKFLAKCAMARKAADAAIGATKRELITMARKHGRDLRLVDPKHTTMDCAACGARAKHALPLHERTYTCTSCGAVSPRDKNSAAIMLILAGLNPVGDDGTRPARPPDEQAA
ncbi:transposase [Streptomyces sp. ID05-26A]|nr:transposase [Streptomyces sp. ID05-26A]